MGPCYKALLIRIMSSGIVGGRKSFGDILEVLKDTKQISDHAKRAKKFADESIRAIREAPCGTFKDCSDEQIANEILRKIENRDRGES